VPQTHEIYIHFIKSNRRTIALPPGKANSNFQEKPIVLALKQAKTDYFGFEASKMFSTFSKVNKFN
jgi:hypothetical protein